MRRPGLTWDGDPRVKPPFGAAEVDWRHPLANGLVGLWLMNEAAGPVYNMIQRRPETVVTTSGWSVNASGLTLTARTIGDGIQLPSTTEDLTVDWTIVARLRRQTLPAGGLAIPIYSRWTNTTTQRQFYFYFRPPDVASPNQLQLDIPWIAAILTGATPLTDTTTVHSVGASRAGTAWTAWLDGIADGSATNATAQESAQTTSPWWGYGTFDNMSMAGDFTQALVWRVAQPASRMLQLHTEPYAMLRPRVARRYFVPAAAGGMLPYTPLRRRRLLT